MNTEQNIAFIAGGKDSLFVILNGTLESNLEIDFDFDYDIFDIIASINTKGKFYLLANRYKK